MKKLLLLVALLMPAMASAQANWNYSRIFPDTTFYKSRARCLTGTNGATRGACNWSMHGIAVDGEGKVWVQGYYPTDSVQVASIPGTPFRGVTVIYVFKAGEQVSFSPIKFVTVGTVTDTLGGATIGTTTKNWEYRTGRGLRADHQGNILVSVGAVNGESMLWRINHQTGEGMARAKTGLSRAAPAVDDMGNIYLAAVTSGNPLQKYDANFVFKENVMTKTPGFSRSFEVSPDGNSVYWAGYTTHAVHLYRRPNEFSTYDSLGAVIPGVDSESLTRTADGKLWVAAGSTTDAANRFVSPTAVPVITNYANQKWYSFNMASLTPITAANSNNWATPVLPAIIDSLAWNRTAFRGVDDGGVGRPRGIAFSSDSKVAYAAMFLNGNSYQIQRHNSPLITANDAEEIPSGMVLEANYPNPFSQTTHIRYALPQAAEVSLVVFDLLGRQVATLVKGLEAAGQYEVTFDSSNLSNGQYIYRLSANGAVLSRNLMVIK